MDTYLKEISAHGLLSDEQEQALARRVAAGDSSAAGELVTANLRFVVSVARQYANRGVDVEDLVSEGNIGMLAAAGRFHKSRGKRFVSFAAPYVRQAIESAIERTAGIYPVPARHATSANLRQSHALSVDAPLPAGSHTTFSLLSVIVNKDSSLADDDLSFAELSERTLAAMSCLSDRERAVVRAVYGVGEPAATMAETGMRLGLRRERVRQIRDKALRKLSRSLRQGRAT